MRCEAEVCVKRFGDAFCDVEGGHSTGGPYTRVASRYNLKDVVELHKLFRSFHAELPQHGMDLKAAEVKLSKAEKKRVQLLETVDTRPPEAKWWKQDLYRNLGSRRFFTQ
jgi:hypothetical protein